MQRTITAKFVAWPAARFIRPAGRAWERRLGLHASVPFHRAATRRQTLHPLRVEAADWSPAVSSRPARRSGLVRASVTFHWVGADMPASARRPSPTPAPWRG